MKRRFSKGWFYCTLTVLLYYPVLQNIGLFLNTFLNLVKLFTIHFGQKDYNILIFGRTNLANFVSKIKQIVTSVLFKKF